MAKLSARNRTELVRFEHESNGSSTLTDWSRTTIALMSDGKVLKKYDVRFLPDGRKHSYGWKVAGRTTKSAEEFSTHYLAKGWKKL